MSKKVNYRSQVWKSKVSMRNSKFKWEIDHLFSVGLIDIQNSTSVNVVHSSTNRQNSTLKSDPIRNLIQYWHCQHSLEYTLKGMNHSVLNVIDVDCAIRMMPKASCRFLDYHVNRIFVLFLRSKISLYNKCVLLTLQMVAYTPWDLAQWDRTVWSCPICALRWASLRTRDQSS